MKTIVEPGRRTRVFAEPDVLVVGGGAAGIAAACASARGGARTLLVERHGFLGGTLTAVTLGGICGAYGVADETHLFRTVGGLYLDVEARLAVRQAILAPRRHGRIVGVPYESVVFRSMADELVAAHGVGVLFHALAVSVTRDRDRITHVMLETKGGRLALSPKVVVDCSGDADIAAAAGVPFSLGEDGITQFGSTMFRLCNVDTALAEKLTRTEIREFLERAVADGVDLPRTATGVHLNPLEGVAHLNVTRLRRSDGEPFDLTNPEELTAAEIEGRRQAHLYENVFRRYVPGFSRARIVDIGATVGIRESRLIEGDRTLTETDVRECVKPDDRIACTAWPLESHGGGRGTNWEFLPDREWYGIPFGCLVAKTLENLLVAGRNLSATHVAQASARVAGPCFAMGEAAGTAAAMACRHGGAVRAAPVTDVQAELVRHGAVLTPEVA
ncbi:MAG: FAD-dependent oxidoreductase [Burkholderiales bacterium]|nr:FAD-dependent oxidoreductase [Burkholderiales bacterium]